jgi:hypothetical protein
MIIFTLVRHAISVAMSPTGKTRKGIKIMEKRLAHNLPPAPIADIVARVESQWRVTLAPMKESRHA